MSAANGSRSTIQIKARARAHKRRFLRRTGLRAHELDPIAAEYLEHVARGKAIMDLREESEGATGTESRDYWVAFNGVSRAIEKLERRLQLLGLDAPAKRNGLATLAAQGRAAIEARAGS